MIRVAIIDDEPLIRLGIREVIRWEQYGCEVVAECSNGKSALQYIHNNSVDLVICDVHMPMMNGIQFLEELAKLDSTMSPSVIMLSAYSDYEYVRKGFVLGALDYLVKDHLDEKSFIPVITEAVSKIQALKKQRHEKEAESHLHLRKHREEALKLLLSRDPSEALNAELPPEWNQEFQGTQQVLISVMLDRFQSGKWLDTDQARTARQSIQQVLTIQSSGAYLVNIADYELAVLLPYTSSLSIQLIRKETAEIAHQMQSHLKQYVNTTSSVGIAEPCMGEAYWKVRYQRAKSLAMLRFKRGYGRTYLWEEAVNLEYQLVPLLEGKSLIAKIKNGDPSWSQELDSWYEQWNGAGITFNKDDVIVQYKGLLYDLSALLHSAKLNWREVIKDNDQDPVEYVKVWETLEQIHAWIKPLVKEIAARFHPVDQFQDSSKSVVQKIRFFLETHYHQPVSLAQVAEMLGFSESYVSKMVVRETGENYIDLLTRIRIERSLELIQSGGKLYEIGREVGYPNQSHFSRVFKKLTGMSPMEYKEQLGGQKLRM
jgi:two-component system, response regulator YesN